MTQKYNWVNVDHQLRQVVCFRPIKFQAGEVYDQTIFLDQRWFEFPLSWWQWRASLPLTMTITVCGQNTKSVTSFKATFNETKWLRGNNIWLWNLLKVLKLGDPTSVLNTEGISILIINQLLIQNYQPNLFTNTQKWDH